MKYKVYIMEKNEVVVTVEAENTHKAVAKAIEGYSTGKGDIKILNREIRPEILKDENEKGSN